MNLEDIKEYQESLEEDFGEYIQNFYDRVEETQESLTNAIWPPLPEEEQTL